MEKSCQKWCFVDLRCMSEKLPKMKKKFFFKNLNTSVFWFKRLFGTYMDSQSSIFALFPVKFTLFLLFASNFHEISRKKGRLSKKARKTDKQEKNHLECVKYQKLRCFCA